MFNDVEAGNRVEAFICERKDVVVNHTVVFDVRNVKQVRTEPIPAAQAEEAADARMAMLEALSMYSDELMELLLSESEVRMTDISVRSALMRVRWNDSPVRRFESSSDTSNGTALPVCS